MPAYALTCAVLTAVAFCLHAIGLAPLAAALFPLPVALFWARGARGRALGLMACAAAVGILGGILAALWDSWTGQAAPATDHLRHGVFLVAEYGLAAGIGTVMGTVLARRWPLGRCVAAVTAVVYLLVAGQMLFHWREYRENVTVFMNARIAEVEEAEETGPFEEASIGAMRWVDTHWEYLSLGTTFGSVLLLVTAAMSVLAGWLRRSGGVYAVRGSFRDFRPPEWFVWAAIVLAGLWFVEDRWPNELLRVITWNSAIGLGFVYWMNGFAILVYGLSALQVHPFLFYAVVFALFYLGAYPLLGAVGLFDTWWEFRRKFDQLVEARQMKNESGDSN